MPPTDDATLAAIDRVDRAVSELRSDLSGRLDAVVTRREHDAEVRRIDAEHRALAESHAALVLSADQEHAAIRDALAGDQAERRAERRAAEDARRADRRTYLAVTVAALGVAVALASLLVTLITR